MKLNCLLLAMPFLFITCKKTGEPLFRNVPSDQSGIDFNNQLTYHDSLTVLDFEYLFNGGGVALIDLDNDGLQDVYFTGNMVSSRMYLNKGNLKFEDVTEKAGITTNGWCYGAAVVDINQDGFKDIYVCKAGNPKTLPSQMENYFFVNNGDGTFSDKAAEMGLASDGHDIQAAFFDFDKDGDLDMYLLKNAFVSYNRNQIRQKQLNGLAASNDKLYRNNGLDENGLPNFTDISEEAGISTEGFGLGVAICDLNEDGWPDVFVSNDFLTNDLIWVNNKDGTFTNKAKQYFKHQTYNSMGNDVADFNNDGKVDLVEVDMLPPDNKRWKLTIMGNRWDQFEQTLRAGYEPQYVRNTLQLNTGLGKNGEPTFSEIGQMAGIHATEWSWAPLFADFDNDGWKDLYIANGYRQDVTNLDYIMYGKTALFMGTADANRKERIEELKKYPGIEASNVMYHNQRDLTFKDASKNWGLNEPSYSNGVAYGDLDNDGDLDLVVNNLDQTAFVFENRANGGPTKSNWLRLKFEGIEQNRDGYGTQIWLWQNGHVQYQFFSPYRGYLSSVEHAVHFGLEAGANVDSLRVQWPDGKEQLLQNFNANQVLTLRHADARKLAPIDSPISNSLVFQEISPEQLGINFQHEEDGFIDFNSQPLLQHLHSRNGPGIAVGDLNGDGLEDFIVGAAAGFSRKIFTQNKNATFTKTTFTEKNTADDMGILLFDADLDGDLDLYVAAGGALPENAGEEVYQHHFYVNDSRGGFSPSRAIPSIKSSAATVSANDFDHDGDLDLFITGRLNPNEYPTTPDSYLLRNDTKDGTPKFTDITPKALKNAGMVSTTIWTDFDNDGWQDLLLVGEWMPLTFFKNENGSFPQPPITIQHSNGWWNSLAAADFDQDGDMDYIAGNRGLNGFHKASPAEPVQLYASDFDENGEIDPLMTHFFEGKEYLAHTREDINKQISAMRGRFRNYSEYAERTFQKSFRKDELADALHFSAEIFASVYLENKGKGHFEIHQLPNEVQMSPIFAMLPEDVNGDGNMDVLCVGNNFSSEVQNGRYDAQGSFVLFGDGNGGFTWNRSIFYLDGDAKSLVKLHLADDNILYLTGINSAGLKAFKHYRTTLESIALQPSDAYALITMRDGRTERREFFFGNSYLSQSSRIFDRQPWMKKVVIMNNYGERKSW